MLQPIRCQAITWNQFDRLVREVALAIRASSFRPEVVVAIARGGFVPARILCDHLGVMELASFRIEHYQGLTMAKEARIRDPLNIAVGGKAVLVVDDLSDTGETFEVAVRHLRELGAAEVRTAALHHKHQSKFEPDYFARRIRRWRWLSYPWARLEDINSLVTSGQLQGSPEQLAAQLREHHGLRVSAQMVADALGLRP